MRPSYFNEIYDGAGTLRGPYEALREVYRGLGDEKDLACRREARGAWGHLPCR
jgi:hypothetical protein